MSSDDDVRADIAAARGMYKGRDLPAAEVRRLAREVDASDVVSEMFPGLTGLQAELDRLTAAGPAPVTCAELASAMRALFAGLVDVIRHPNADLSFPPPGRVQPGMDKPGPMPSRARLPKKPRQSPHLREDS